MYNKYKDGNHGLKNNAKIRTKALFGKEGGTRDHAHTTVIPAYFRVTGVLRPSHDIRFYKTPGSAEPPSLLKRAGAGLCCVQLVIRIIKK